MSAFSLFFNRGVDVGGLLEGELFSESLNEVLFPDKKVCLVLETASGGKLEGRLELKKGQFYIDSFQLQGLAAFLSLQENLHEILREELAKDRQNWRSSAKKIDGLEGSKIVSLDLRRRLTLSGQKYENFCKIFGPEKGAEYAGCDSDETQSFFTITIDARWDKEHLLRAEFRNGVCEAMGHS